MSDSSESVTLFPLRQQSLSRLLPSPGDHLQDPTPPTLWGRVGGTFWRGCVDGSSPGLLLHDLLLLGLGNLVTVL